MAATDEFTDLVQLMAQLRQECPWDKKQTNNSLIPYALEETFELTQAILADDNSKKADDDIKGELGDVLLQVVFHSRLYEEQGRFTMADVIHQLQQKLIRRHPHIFENETLTTDFDVKKRWDEIKAMEAKDTPKQFLSQVKAGTALMQAQEIQKQAAKIGFDWANLGGVMDKLDEEIGELKTKLPSGDFNYKTDKLDKSQKQTIADELGDVLFVLTNLARHLGIDSETALQAAIVKFRRRAAYVEERLLHQGKTFADSTVEQMDELWIQAKLHETSECG